MTKFMYLLWKANAIISYNNRPATEAVPYFEQVLILILFSDELILHLSWELRECYNRISEC